jgi:hypothetical protein
MKHVRTFENYDNMKLSDLAKHISNFLENFKDTSNFKVDNFKVDDGFVHEFYNVWFISPNRENRVKYCIFSFTKFDYYYGDPDIYFKFKLDPGVKNVSYMNEETYNIVFFIDDIMNNYNKNQNMIAYSDIPNIINDISIEKYELFLNTKKYNL